MIQIIVDSEKVKQDLLAESKYIHDFDRTIDIGNKKPLVIGLDIDRCNILSHIYLNPDMIIIKS
jgi:hypothetical protein